MSASKRPSTSSLRRFITTRPYVTVAELRRRFCLEADGVCRVERPGSAAFIGVPEREAAKLQELWQRDEIGLELSVEVHAPVVVGIYPMRIARFVQEQAVNGHGPVALPPSRPSLGEPMAKQANADVADHGDGATANNGHPTSHTSNGSATNGRERNGNGPWLDRRGNGNLNDFAHGRTAPSRGA